MARLQWCREHLTDEVAEACDLSKSAVAEVKQAARFCDEHSEFSELPTKPIIALIRIKDPIIKERAIIKCKERLNGKIGAGRGNTKELTERTVKKLIEDTEIEVRKEEIKRLEEAERDSCVKTITQAEVDAIMGRGGEKFPDVITNKQGNRIYTEEEVLKIRSETPEGMVITIAIQYEIDSLFEMLERIRCSEDIPKYQKRIRMMLENKTLLLVG